jgi:hypothetical protein
MTTDPVSIRGRGAADNPPNRFERLHYSPDPDSDDPDDPAPTTLRYLDSKQAGTASQFLAAFRQIVARLHTDPIPFGEPRYRLPALRLLVMQAVLSPVVVDYAVHED